MFALSLILDLAMKVISAQLLEVFESLDCCSQSHNSFPASLSSLDQSLTCDQRAIDES